MTGADNRLLSIIGYHMNLKKVARWSLHDTTDFNLQGPRLSHRLESLENGHFVPQNCLKEHGQIEQSSGGICLRVNKFKKLRDLPARRCQKMKYLE